MGDPRKLLADLVSADNLFLGSTIAATIQHLEGVIRIIGPLAAAASGSHSPGVPPRHADVADLVTAAIKNLGEARALLPGN
jgi:hypothetical protein